MQKYLTQHSLKAFTIKVPQALINDNQKEFSLKKYDLESGEALLFKCFVQFLSKNRTAVWNNLPVFNFLITFYDVLFVAETKQYLEFNLLLSKALNQNILSKLKHSLFNQYNALIGFTEVLKEEEEFDDTIRQIIDRINFNARNLFENTQHLIEFERLKQHTTKLESNVVEPAEYMASFLRHRKDRTENIRQKFQSTKTDNSLVNIENKPFKTSLNWILDKLKETGDLSKTTCILALDKQCEICFENTDEGILQSDFLSEIDQFNQYINSGDNAIQINQSIFMLLYTRLIAEKLNAEFTIEIIKSPKFCLVAKWRFPITKMEAFEDEEKRENTLIQNEPEHRDKNEKEYGYPQALREELVYLYQTVKETFILDDWKIFADKIDQVCSKYKGCDASDLANIAQAIRLAVSGFDITSLQKIGRKIEQISKSE